MYVEDLHIIKPSTYGPYTTIQAAIQAALASVPPAAVFITPEYTGTDTYTNASGVPVLDLRPAALNAGQQLGKSLVSGVPSGIQTVAAAAAPITAAAGGTFVTTLNAPGAGALEQVPFTVKASGFVTFPAGTYTAAIQPLLYASAVAGYTASAAAAIYSAAAVSITFASATLPVTKPFSIEAHLIGESTGHTLSGYTQGLGYASPGVNATLADTIISNPVTVFTASAAIPVQFQFGVVGGAGFPATGVVNLGSFILEV